MVNVVISGSGGRMGRALLEAAAATADVAITGLLEHASSPLLGRDGVELSAKAKGIKIASEATQMLNGAHVLIDFTRPEATLAYLDACRKLKVNAVIGTTGFSTEQRATIESAAKEIGIVFAPNMSIGVNVTLKLVEMATKALHQQYDIEIIEAHHKLKVDAPSGTALKMGEVAAAAMGKSLNEVGVFGRHGVTGERKPGTIGFTAIRGGDIIGDHTVLYAGTGERIEITHKSSSRTNYAQGALRAAQFIADKKTGLFGMDDVLGLR